MRRSLTFLVLAAILPACGGGGSGGVLPPPLGLSPSVVRIGQEIVIQGPSFGSAQGASTVTVGGAAATVVSWSAFEVRILAPAAALSGVVELTVGGVPINPGSVTLLWPLFNPANVAVSTAASNQELPQVVSDGAGGVIIVWQDNRAGTLDIYAQRLDGSGAAQWTADGTGVCTVAGVQDTPGICADGSGGAIFAWRDSRSGGQIHLYAQRLNSSGAAQWTAGGVPVQAIGAVAAEVPRIVTDGSGGGIIVWADLRNAEHDLYAQRLEGTAGSAQWTVNGITLCNATSTQARAWTGPDGSGGVVMAWMDFRNGNADIFAQRLNSAGAAQWTANGVAVCTSVNSQDFCQLIPYGTGGMIVVWEDERNGVGNKDIFGQRLDGAGAAQWATNGVAVCTAVAHQAHAQIISDGSGGAVIAWEDLSYYS